MTTPPERIEEKLAGKIVICDGLYTSKVGTILGTGSSRHSIKLLVDGLERYEPDYALLHVTEDNEQAIILLLSHHQELQKAREEAYKAGQSDLIYCLGNSFSKGKHHIDEFLLEANYQAKRLQDQSELDQPTNITSE